MQGNADGQGDGHAAPGGVDAHGQDHHVKASGEHDGLGCRAHRVTPCAPSHTADSRQRTVPVTCSTNRWRISVGSESGRASTFATSGTMGG